MPIYEYRCESCEHRLEKLQKMSEGDMVDCPECKRPALKRLVSASAFRLKGGGWYETDFKQDNKRNLADSSGKETSDKSSEDKSTADKKSTVADSKKADSTSDQNSTKTTETKPAAKPASKESKDA